MLSKKIYNKSVYQLENYLKKVRKRPLTLVKFNEISALIKIKRKENQEFAERLLDSKLFSLATEYLKGEGKAERVVLNENSYYDYEAIDIILTMKKILDESHRKNILL